MFGKLLPRQTDFFNYFELLSDIILQASQTFIAIVEKEQIHFPNPTNPLKTLEHQADEITHHCLDVLHKSFITPFHQEEIFRLINRMDDIVDCIDEASSNLQIYKIQKPTKEVQKLANLLVTACEKVQVIAYALRIRKKEFLHIRIECKSIKEIEHEADEVFSHALGNLFENEADIRQVIKWKEIYENIEESIDHCQDVANIIEGLLLEYS